jgi:DNA polymerase I-like protein with 3'-5' exonuclease and polymerase domains
MGVRIPRQRTTAVHLNLTPIKSTDSPKKSIPWERVMKLPKSEQLKYNPSTDKESIAILAADCPFLNDYRQFKIVDQLRKNFLTEELEDEETGEWDFEKGIGSYVDKRDGRLRTNFRQTLETGRYATSPNLQNWPKKQEEDYRKCFRDEFGKLDPRYNALRSTMIASPGCVLVEPDWSQAELWTLGALAKDDTFLHTLASGDLHTEMMQKMFGSLPFDGKKISDSTGAC